MQDLTSFEDLVKENLYPITENDYSAINSNIVCNCPMTFDVDTLKVYDSTGYISDLDVVQTEWY